MTTKLSGPMLAPTSGTPKSIVVLLHGYGSDGRDLIALGQFWQSAFPDTLFVAPNAHQPCELSPTGYQWFAINMDGDRDFARMSGSETARPIITGFLEDLWAQTGLGPRDTMLAGFSQGAMMALDVGLRLPTPLKGIIAFSGVLIAPETLVPQIASKPPVLLVHGDMDDVVPVLGSEAAHAVLLDNGFDVALHISPGGPHTIGQDGLEVATAFLKTHIAP